MRQDLKRLFPVIVVLVLLLVLTVIWYVMFPPSAWEDIPNYLQMYIGFVVTRPIDAFLNVNTGPGGTIVALPFLPTYALMAIHIILYRFGKQMKQQITILNKYYLIYLVVLGLFTISFQNASQYYNWYWNPKLNASGYVDTWTHILSPTLLGSLIIPFAFERYFGLGQKVQVVLHIRSACKRGTSVGNRRNFRCLSESHSALF